MRDGSEPLPSGSAGADRMTRFLARATFTAILVVLLVEALGIAAFGMVPHGPLWNPLLLVVVVIAIGLEAS